MDKSIDFIELKNRNFDKTGISNYKINIICEKCQSSYFPIVKKFLVRKKIVPQCHSCYFKYNVHDHEWREKNRQAQLIAQNRPEVKEKQRIAQKKRHLKPEVKKRYREIGKEVWKRPEYRRVQIEKLKNNWKDPQYREKVFKNSKKQYIGEYKGLFYHSLVEFSFILYCEKRHIEIKRYDLQGIDYFYDDKLRKYYPDFIINENTIVEVKDKGRWYKRDKKQINVKYQALCKWCELNNMKCRMIFDTDIGKNLWYKAKETYETEKENL